MHPRIQYWKMHWDRFSEKHLQWVFGAALASFFLSLFVKITFTLRADSTLQPVDDFLLTAVQSMRTPLSTRLAVEVTTLGAPVVLGLVCFGVVCILLLVARDRWAAFQMAFVSASA